MADGVRFEAFRERLPRLDHDSYTAAWAVVYFDRDDEFGLLVCHGEPRRPGVGDRYGHAWVEVELDGGWMCFDRSQGLDLLCPRSMAYEVGDVVADDVVRYTSRQFADLVLGTDTYGPFTDADRARWLSS